MFRKVLMAIGLVLATSAAVFAQGTLKGTITDSKTQEPLPFVNVVAKQDGQQIRGGQTDFDGVYTIKPLPVGKYDIEVSSVGYQKYVRTGVNVTASGFTIADIQLVPTATNLEEVVIVEQKVPVIEIGTPESGSRLSSDDIARMPGTSVDAIVAAVGGVGYSDGGTSTARGEDGMVTMQGGVRKRTGIQAPKEAIAEIQVILGGTPASIGEAIGGTQIITLKPPSSQFKGIVKWESWLDYRLANNLMVYLTGPLVKQKIELDGGGTSERTLVGFRLTAQGSFSRTGFYRPRSDKYLVVNHDKVLEYEQNPIDFDPLTGTVDYSAQKNLYRSDFVTLTTPTKSDFNGDASRVPNLRSFGFAAEGAIDVRFSDYATLTVTAEGSYSRSPGISVGGMVLNLSRQGVGIGEGANYGITVDFTQRFRDQEETSADATLPEGKKSPVISNVMYNLTAMVSRSTSKSYNEIFGSSLDDIFKYGHIGTFYTEKFRSYDNPAPYDYHGVTVSAYEQNGWRDEIQWDKYVSDPDHQVLSNYNLQLNRIDELKGVLTDFDFLRQYKGLPNGEGPSSIYGLFSNVGVMDIGYSFGRTDYIYLQAKASALVKGHDLEIGFQYDRYSSSSYGVSAYGIWTLMRQEANKHLQQLDKTNPIYRWEGSKLYVDYNRLYNASQQEPFDIALREYLGLAKNSTDFIDIDRYSPEVFANAGGIKMFSADELFNQGSSYVSYTGYDHTGEKYNGRNWTLEDFYNPSAAGHPNYRYLPAFSPTYMAGYIQDKFYFQDLIFNVGVRLDYFDGNQFVLKDPYLLYESYTVGDVRNGNALVDGSIYNGAGDNWVVYVDDPSAAAPSILGYRNGSVWYNASGVEVSSPNQIAGKSGKPTPYRTPRGREAAGNNAVGTEAFVDYKPQVVVMPRIAFSFPVGDNSQFKASYDIIARRPSSGWQANYLGYLYMSQISTISNPNLKPERITNYELGFQQALSSSSAISISAYYKETRDLIQLVQYAGADPNNNYYSYDNLDFKTIKGFTFAYDLRQTKNIRINANYTLQYAEGTGLATSTMTELIKEGYTTLKMLNPISDDRRHEFKASIDFRYGNGAKYNGPTITRVVTDKATGEKRNKDIKLLEDFGVNFLLVAQSGRPYTRQYSITQNTIVGSYRGARLPWGFYCNVIIDKNWPIKVGKRTTYLNTAITINNLFDIRNIVGVFPVTGSPTDNGYLTDPETQVTINSYLDPQSFRDLYSIYLSNATWNYSSPRHIKLSLSYSF
ncbi:MAG: TonB-dependent receptor [Bacteroidales bacterium]|nr:TonB-dependent receptor [Bacteroidales bacterium]